VCVLCNGRENVVQWERECCAMGKGTRGATVVPPDSRTGLGISCREYCMVLHLWCLTIFIFFFFFLNFLKV